MWIRNIENITTASDKGLATGTLTLCNIDNIDMAEIE